MKRLYLCTMMLAAQNNNDYSFIMSIDNVKN